MHAIALPYTTHQKRNITHSLSLFLVFIIYVIFGSNNQLIHQ